jgi:hypothetical protein
MAVVLAGVGAMAYPPVGLTYGAAGPPKHSAAGRTSGSSTAVYRQTFLPDLLVVKPKGLSTSELAKIAKASGVRNVIAADGAAIKLNGHKANVLGVDPQQFRSWTPLATSSDQRLWTALERGHFVTSVRLARRLKLDPGTKYALTGGGTQHLIFGGASPLGVNGIDALVSNKASARLGLVHGVMALISAPGASMARLSRAVRAITGSGASIVSLRSQQLPSNQAPSGARPSTYLELFQQSAARFCPGLSWTVLAAIGQIESGDGSNMGPSTSGALGPMQFLPSTWKRWGITAFGQTGAPNIMNAYDAVASAARYLCAAGAGTSGGLSGAIFAYNHATWYVNEVLALAQQYAQTYG